VFKKYGGRINEFFCEFFGAEMRVRNYIHSEEHNNVLNDIDDSDSVGLDDEDDSSSTGVHLTMVTVTSVMTHPFPQGTKSN